VAKGNTITFTVTVTDNATSDTKTAPTGTVSWKASITGGSFSSITCTLGPISSSASSCVVTYTSPTITGTHTITGIYGGDNTHIKSSGTSKLTIS